MDELEKEAERRFSGMAQMMEVIRELESRPDVSTELQDKRIEKLERLSVYIFNIGYSLGHNDTVESVYVDIHPDDMDEYHAEEVAELIEGMRKARGGE